jgi:hypothetical protein
MQYESFSQTKESHCIPVRSLSESTYPFKAGESFGLTIHYKWGLVNTDLGSASVVLDSSILNGVPVFHCTATGRTYKFYDMFFKVRENFQSWFTRKDLSPMKFTRNTSEGDYSARNYFIYKHDKVNPKIEANNYSSKKGEYSIALPLTKCTYDIPSLFYMARNIDLSKVRQGVRYPMTFVIDNDVYNVYFVYWGKMTKTVPGLGKVRTMKFSAKLLEGQVFKGDKDMLLWISDDENRLPVYAEASIRVGLVSLRLSSYSGLKSPFKAIVK